MSVSTQIQTMARTISRLTLGPMLVRGIAFGAGVVAVGIAMPVSLMSPAAMFSGAALAGLAALRPGSMTVGFAQLCTVVLWLVGTSLDAGLPTGVALIGLACALYIQHAACALAAAIPLDAVVLPAVLTRWLSRLGIVVAATVVLGAVVVFLPRWLSPHPSLLFPLLGVTGVIVIAGIFGYLVLRSPHRGA